MRALVCFCLALGVLNVLAEEENKDVGLEPKIYADISKSAQEDAVSFGGIRGLVGIGAAFQNIDASVGDGGAFTKNNVNSFGLCLGLEYAKAFRKGFLIAVDVGLETSKKIEKENNWKELNGEYAIQRGKDGIGKLKKDAISPMAALKFGYLLPTHESMVFAKLGVSQIGGSYCYKENGLESSADFKVYIPSVGVGIERKINKKLGASLEADLSIKRNFKSSLGGFDHNTRISRFDLRLIAAYSVSKDKQPAL
jgi:hypothetical protein